MPSITNTELARRFDDFVKSEQKNYDALLGMIKSQSEKQDLILGTIQEVQVSVAVADTDRIAMKKDIDDLEKRVNGWSITNSVAAAIAMLLGIFGINK